MKSDETTDLSATNQPVMTRIRIKKRDKDEYAQTDAPSVRGDGELTGAAFVLYHTVRVTASVCGCLLFGKILDGIKRALHGKHRG